ncbi:MAG: polysaccharide pyruvyl transferase CsaB [bacterium]
MRYVVLGYYGYNNAGDEALKEVLFKQISALDDKADIKFHSSRSKLFSVFSDIRRADVAIAGGGGLLQDVTGSLTIPYYLGLLYFAKILRKKAFMLGQGLGPVNKHINRMLIKWILPKLDGISFRDNASKELAENFCGKLDKAILAADLGLLLEPLGTAAKDQLYQKYLKDDKLRIAFALREPVRGAPEDFINDLKQFMGFIIERYQAHIYFIPFHHPHDLAIAKNLASSFKADTTVIEDLLSPKAVLSLISGMDAMVAMRLHALIFAFAVHVPSLGISYDPKVLSFQNGLNLPVIPLDEMNFDKLRVAFEDLYGRRSSLIPHLNDLGLQQQSLASENFHFLNGLLFPNKMKEVVMLGVIIDNITMTEALKRAHEMMHSKKPHLVFTPNPEMIVRTLKELKLKDTLNAADMRLPDGSGLLFTGKYIGKRLKERVSGIDFMLELVRLAAHEGRRVFFFGGEPGTADIAVHKLKEKYNNLQVCGTASGYFDIKDEAELIAKIRESKPDILFAGLGAGKQEYWLTEHKDELGASILMGIGGSMDVISGKLKRAPHWIQNLGIEWMHRLVTQPWRWKRMLALPRFFLTNIWVERIRRH